MWTVLRSRHYLPTLCCQVGTIWTRTLVTTVSLQRFSYNVRLLPTRCVPVLQKCNYFMNETNDRTPESDQADKQRNKYKSIIRRQRNNNKTLSTIKDLSIFKRLSAEVLSIKTVSYDPSPSVLHRSADELYEFRKAHSIVFKGDERPRPILQFEDYAFSSFIMEAISSAGFVQPSPIQSESWPIALSGRDLISISQSGTGKTLAFVLPVLTHVTKQLPAAEDTKPCVFILTRTHDLAKQTKHVIKTFSMDNDIRASFLPNISSYQKNHINSDAQICVSTPWRLLEYVTSGLITLNQCTLIVIDEADSLLYPSCIEFIQQIFSYLRSDCQVMFFSSSWPDSVDEMAQKCLDSPIQVCVGGSNSLSAHPNIRQYIHMCEPTDRYSKLKELLDSAQDIPSYKIILFVDNKQEFDELSFRLRNSFKVGRIEENMSAGERNQVYAGFDSGSINLVTVSGITLRGLDFHGITHVINYNFPLSSNEYIHRIGHAYRLGEEGGEAHTFLYGTNPYIIKDLITILKNSNQQVPNELQQLHTTLQRFIKPKVKEPKPLKTNVYEYIQK